MPFEIDIHFCGQDCVSPLNKLAKLYNSKLKSLLEDLTKNLSGSTFVYADYYAVVEDLINNYRSYGEIQQWTLKLGFGKVNEIWILIFFFPDFEKANHACCELIGRHGGLFPCLPVCRICPDRTKYVFWDPFHLTESANLIVAKQLLDGGLEYVSPINIRQLANSWWHAIFRVTDNV